MFFELAERLFVCDSSFVQYDQRIIREPSKKTITPGLGCLDRFAHSIIGTACLLEQQDPARGRPQHPLLIGQFSLVCVVGLGARPPGTRLSPPPLGLARGGGGPAASLSVRQSVPRVGPAAVTSQGMQNLLPPPNIWRLYS